MIITEKKNRSWRIWLGAASLMLALAIGFFTEQFSIVSFAQSQGKVTATSANIRKEANASSQVLGSAAQNASVTINHQVQASDGTIWYQVFVNADTLGYIRSDLVTITDGSTPSTVTSSTSSAGTTGQTSSNGETPASVTAVNPISATVTKSDRVRVRSNASTTSQIVTTVEKDFALTVTGQTNGADNMTWYQVEFISNGSQVTGFIRSDYVALSGEVTTVTPETPVPPTEADPGTTETPSDEQVVTKDWETQLQGDKWYLLDMVKEGQYSIDELFNAVETNKEAYLDSQKTVKSQKIVIVILVIILIALAAAVGLLIYKIKDMMDSAYFSEVEKDTIRRREDVRPQGNRPQGSRPKEGQKVMHTVGAEKKQVPGAQAARPAGAAGERPAGARPQGSQPQQARPQGSQSQQAKPQGGQPQQPRPQGSQSQQAKPQGGQPQQARPQGGQPQQARPQGGQPQQPRPQGNRQQDPNAKSKNFAAEDDEFEFEFLNWDGEEE